MLCPKPLQSGRGCRSRRSVTVRRGPGREPCKASRTQQAAAPLHAGQRSRCFLHSFLLPRPCSRVASATEMSPSRKGVPPRRVSHVVLGGVCVKGTPRRGSYETPEALGADRRAPGFRAAPDHAAAALNLNFLTHPDPARLGLPTIFGPQQLFGTRGKSRVRIVAIV